MQLQGLTSNALAGRTSSRNNFNLIKDQKYEKVKLFRAQNLNETNGDLPDWGICRDLANTALYRNCLLTGRMKCAVCSAPMVKSRALSTYLSCLLPSSPLLLVPHSTRPSALAPTSFFVVFFSSLNAVRPRVVYWIGRTRVIVRFRKKDERRGIVCTFGGAAETRSDGH